MKSGSVRFSLLPRLSLVAAVVCATMPMVSVRVAAARSPQSQQEAPRKPQANDLVVIKAGSVPGRRSDGVLVDAGHCQSGGSRQAISTQGRSVVTHTYNVKEGFPIGTGTIKDGVYLCGDGVAIDHQVVVLSRSSRIETLPKTLPNLRLIRPLLVADSTFSLLQINLYDIIDDTPVASVVNSITLQFGNILTATPNYEIAAKPSPSIGGSPSGMPGLPMTASQFRDQWAFSTVRDAQRAGNGPSGRNVDIGIFDTYCGRTNVRGLHASRPTFLATFPQTATEGINVCGHGAYVASLTNAVAPSAGIYLYRVLDDYGLGDMATLINAIDQFTKMAARQRLFAKDKAQPLGGTVINLSLGINSAEGDEAIPLRDVLRRAYDSGALIVSAAGNDAEVDEPTPQEQLPAAYNFVIGVGASDQQNGRASYSNWVPADLGDVAAPGGDGNCLGPNSAGGCVVGYYPTCHASFRAWSGTSFATPLVSGLAALVEEKGSYRLRPPEVRAAILNGVVPNDPSTGLGKGIVDVPRTLAAVP